jgi:hypothetical protein
MCEMESDMAVYGYAQVSTDGVFICPIGGTERREMRQDISGENQWR